MGREDGQSNGHKNMEVKHERLEETSCDEIATRIGKVESSSPEELTEAEQSQLPQNGESDVTDTKGFDEAGDRTHSKPKTVGRRSNSGHVKLFACPSCDYSSYNSSTFYRHKQRAHGITQTLKRLGCSRCQYRTNSSVAYTRHIKAAHKERTRHEPFDCPGCDYSSQNKKTLNEHIREHHPLRSLSCPHCIYQTRSEQRLSKHVATHDEKKRLLCPHCPYQTNRKDLFGSHVFSHESSWAKFN